MRALTLKPHWAHAVAHLGKRCENRKRPIPPALLGKRIAIHAGATLPKGWLGQLLHARQWRPGDPHPFDMPREPVTRAIVATAVLAGDWREDPDVFMPPWAVVGAHWWRLDEVVTLDSPIPWRCGQLGLWRLPDELTGPLQSPTLTERRGRDPRNEQS